MRDHGYAGSMDDTQGEAAPQTEGDGLLDRLGLIESQPLEQRAAGFDQLAEELLAELQRGDRELGG